MTVVYTKVSSHLPATVANRFAGYKHHECMNSSARQSNTQKRGRGRDRDGDRERAGAGTETDRDTDNRHTDTDTDTGKQSPVFTTAKRKQPA